MDSDKIRQFLKQKITYKPEQLTENMVPASHYLKLFRLADLQLMDAIQVPDNKADMEKAFAAAAPKITSDFAQKKHLLISGLMMLKFHSPIRHADRRKSDEIIASANGDLDYYNRKKNQQREQSDYVDEFDISSSIRSIGDHSRSMHQAIDRLLAFLDNIEYGEESNYQAVNADELLKTLSTLRQYFQDMQGEAAIRNARKQDVGQNKLEQVMAAVNSDIVGAISNNLEALKKPEAERKKNGWMLIDQSIMVEQEYNYLIDNPEAGAREWAAACKTEEIPRLLTHLALQDQSKEIQTAYTMRSGDQIRPLEASEVFTLEARFGRNINDIKQQLKAAIQKREAGYAESDKASFVQSEIIKDTVQCLRELQVLADPSRGRGVNE